MSTPESDLLSSMRQDARARAAKLIDDFARYEKDLRVNGSTVPPEELEAGQRALGAALNAARGVLDGIGHQSERPIETLGRLLRESA